MGLTLAAMLPYSLLLPWQYILYLSLVLLIQLLVSHLVKEKSRLLKFIFIIIGILIIVQYWGQLQINVIGMALFCLVLVLKPMEMHSQRDQQVWIVLCYFSVIAILFFDNSFLLFIYSSLLIIILTAFVIVIHFPGESFKNSLINSTGLLLKTAPMVLILFIVFPRLGEPAWNLPASGDNGRISVKSQGISGMSNTLNPGDLNQLSLSQETAFRVQFHKRRPESKDLYWRGNAFYFSDGKQWTSDYYLKSYLELQTPVKLNKIIHSKNKKLFEYTINQEAHQQQWLFTLGLPIELQTISNTEAVLSEDNLLLATEPVKQSIQYRQTSFATMRIKNAFKESQKALFLQALQLPENKRMANQTIALGRQWRNQYSDDKALLNHALNWFVQEEFYYSRDVPKYTDNPIDAFLFQGKQGYCGHYATAFAMLMRAADIPARVVTGYKGGEQSFVGNYLTLKQANAHAWVEVWLENEGWSRVDPTAVIPSERILEDDLRAQLRSDEAEQISVQHNKDHDKRSGTSGSSSFNKNFKRQFQQYSEYIDYLWDVWIIQYGQSNQQLLLAFSGLNQVNTVLLITIVAVIVVAIGLMLLLVRWKRPVTLQAVYQSLLKTLQENGFDTYQNEGPETLKKRLSSNMMSQDEKIKYSECIELLNHYMELRYNDKERILSETTLSNKQILDLQKKINSIF